MILPAVKFVSYRKETHIVEMRQGLLKETEFFTTAELAKKLKMNVQVITRKVQAGEIEAFKIGKDWRIPEQSVHNWLARNSNQQHEPTPKQKVVQNYVKDDHIERLPAQRSKRKFLLEYILAQFEPQREYRQEEVDRIINRYHEDYETVRREFVTKNMMEPVNGGYRRRTGYQLSD